MPGLHGLGLARRGTRVTVAVETALAADAVRRAYRRAGCESRLELEVGGSLPDGPFDLVLSFNALPLAPSWRAYLVELARRGSRLMLFVTHPWSYGAWARRTLRLAERRRGGELFDHESTRARRLVPELAKLGTILDRAWVDCPWWPDLFVPTGSSLAGALTSSVTRNRLRAPAPRFVFDAGEFPFASDRLPDELARALGRHPSFEDSRLAPIFAHHRAYLLATSSV